jgi:DNA polymerase-3 subunit delta'
MDNLQLHPVTRKQFVSLLEQVPHGILLVGPSGSGKRTTAIALAASALQTTPEAIIIHPYVRIVTPDGSISIDTVRQLKAFSQLKTTGQQAMRRSIIVEDSQQLTTEAQNALLKLLEEPPADTLIILTVTETSLLLPTVVSRLQTIPIKPVPAAQMQQWFKAKGHLDSEVERALHISGGRVGLMHAMLEAETSHPLLDSIDQAKQLLTASSFERLVLIDGMSKDKQNLSILLDGLHRVCQAALHQAIKKEDPKGIAGWKQRVQRVHKAQAGLKRNANTKLLLTDFVLGL